MKIGMDFDRVLFDTDSFKQFLQEKFENFSETYPEGIYDPEEHAERMDVEKEEIMEALEKAEKYLYNDVECLEKLDHEIVLISRGNPEFQTLKIKKSGVLEYVDDFIVIQEKAKDCEDIDFLVDDLKEEIEEVDVPGFRFERPEDSIKDIEQKVSKKAEVEKIEA